MQCLQNERRRPGELRTSAYQCLHCGHWHVGRRKWRSSNDKIRDRRDRMAQQTPIAMRLHDGM
jgi:hypothetical protein